MGCPGGWGVFDTTTSLRYRDPMVNHYVSDVGGMAAFYREHFGFVETFRTPGAGPPPT